MSHDPMIARVRAIANRHMALIGVFLSAACAGSPRSPDTIVIASGTDLEGMQPLTTVHPLSRQVQRYLVFTPLVRLSPTLAPEPWAASAWSWNSERTQLTFTLDTTLRWHDGAPVRAADVVFTLALAANRSTGYARRGDLEIIRGVTSTGAATIVMQFTSAQANVPLVLAELPLLPEHRLRDVPAAALRAQPFTYAPVGSGPFRVVSREAGRRWIFERVAQFPARMGGVAATRTLVVAVIDEATTKVAGLVSGSLDIAGINPATAALVRRDPTLRVLDYPTFFTNWLVFNPACARVGDVRVRRAIALSLDRRRIVDAGMGGFGVPSASLTADLARDTTRADTSQANALFDAAGWRRNLNGRRERNGKEMALDMLSVGAGDNPVEQLLQSDLLARGVTLRIVTRDMGALLSSARAKSADHCLVYTGVAGDPARSQLAALFDPAAAGGALDFGAARPAPLASAFAQLRTATNTTTRDQAFRQVLAVLDDSVPAIAVFHSRGVQGLSARLQHVDIDLRGELFSAARWTLGPVASP